MSARTELNIDTVRELTVRSPKKSIRMRSSELGLTKSTVQRIIKQDLNLYPYKLEIKQTLTDRDKEQRFQMCTWFNEMMENDEHWVGKIWFSDEARFHLDGSVNRQNCRIWRTEPPTLLPPNHSTAGSAQLGVRLALTESSGLTGLKTMLRMR